MAGQREAAAVHSGVRRTSGRRARTQWEKNKMKPSIVAAAFSIALACCLTALAEDSVPKGWSIAGSKPEAYEIKLDPGQKSEHGNCISFQSKGEPEGFATLMQAIKAADFRGKRVRFSGHIKGEGVKSWAA